jgi:hypothetical protein
MSGETCHWIEARKLSFECASSAGKERRGLGFVNTEKALGSVIAEKRLGE